MKTRTKKLIIILSSVMIFVVATIVAVFVVSNLTTTTVKDLRLVDIESQKEIKDKALESISKGVK